MEEQKLQIIQIAAKLFKQQGIRRVSIDDICGELRISKKTFYNSFAQKEDLVDAFIEYDDLLLVERVEVLCRNKNALECMLILNKEMRKYCEKEVSELVMDDVKKYYPNLFEKHRKVKTERSYQRFLENLKQGVEEGFYRDNLDIELFSILYMSNLNNTQHNTIFGKFPKKRVLDFFFDISIQLIVSGKGLKFIEENYRNG